MGPAEILVLISAAREIVNSIREWRQKKDAVVPETPPPGVPIEQRVQELTTQVDDLRARLVKADEMMEAQARLIEKFAEHTKALAEADNALHRRVTLLTAVSAGAAALALAALLIAWLT